MRPVWFCAPLVVMMYVKFPLPLRNVEDLPTERGISISCKAVLFWWDRFGPAFAAEIRRCGSSAYARLCYGAVNTRTRAEPCQNSVRRRVAKWRLERSTY